MSDQHTPAGPSGYLSALLQCKCSRCRTGRMFRHKLSLNPKRNMEMYTNCPVCGQPMELEVGFYYGTGYVSYALTVAISVATFVAYWVLFGISINDNSLFIWLGVNITILLLSMFYLMRLSRSIWLSFFAKYDPDWRSKEAPKPERVVKEHMQGW